MNFSQFKAAMFDFDGTITVPGVYYPPRNMVNALLALTHKMPIAFCTGRQLESFVDHGLTTLLEDIDLAEHDFFLKNMYLIGENGSMGYKYNTASKLFEEFYSGDWPEEFYSRDKMMEELNSLVKDFGSVYFRRHRVVVVVRTHYHTSGDAKKIASLSSKIYEIIKGYLANISPKYFDYLHIGDSGIGVVVTPADWDKDRGIQEFAKFLRSDRGLDIKDDAKEIIVIGDQPQEGGNDHYFLNGKFGTAFSVGEMTEESEFPMPVIGNNGERLLHIDGTIHLIEGLLSIND